MMKNTPCRDLLAGLATRSRRGRSVLRIAAKPALMALALSACNGGGDGQNQAGAPSNAARLGKLIFDDPSLSASGALACASCHEASRAFASTDAVNAGGAALDQKGTRNAPSLTYLDRTPGFFFVREGTPTGGFNRDGRAPTLAEQARRPFLAPDEMANASAAEVVARLKAAPYAAAFRAEFGPGIFEQGEAAFERALFALEAFQREDARMHAFTSKYDAFLGGRTALTAQEVRGLALFNNPQKGNCAACHPSGRGSDGSAPLFTDFTYDNFGAPRNPNIPANADPTFFDLGLCGPARNDLGNRPDLCGAFKVPSLRNVAITAPYFHNGRFATLTETLRFYVRRDTHPEEFYPRDASGAVQKFDDLPPEYRANVNRTEAPYNRNVGDAPALNDTELADLEAFLDTLTDGWTAAVP